MPPTIGMINKLAEHIKSANKLKIATEFVKKVKTKEEVEAFLLEKYTEFFYNNWRFRIQQIFILSSFSILSILFNVWFIVPSFGLFTALWVLYGYFSIFTKEIKDYALSSKNQKNRTKFIIKISQELYETVFELISKANEDINSNIPLKIKECEDYLSLVPSLLKEREQSKKSLEDALKFLAE